MWYVSTNQTTESSPFTFSDLIKLQEHYFPFARDEGRSHLLFAEVDPVITFGRAQERDLDQESMRLGRDQYGTPWVPGVRGGKETWHGPGQWVMFVVAPLTQFSKDPKGVRVAVHELLHRCFLAASEFRNDLREETEGNRTGLWSPQGKVLSIGVHVRSGCLTSGIAMNVHPTEKSFLGIHPCGLSGEVPDFLFQNMELGQSQMLAVRDALIREVAQG